MSQVASLSYCETNKTSTATFIWTFHSFKTMNFTRESWMFDCGKNNKTLWCLKMNPNRISNQGFISIFLELQTREKIKVNMQKCSVAIIDRNGEKTCQTTMPGCCFEGYSPSLGWSQYVKREFLLENENSLLPNGGLTIFAELVLNEGPVIDKASMICEPQIKRPRSLADDQNGMFINFTFSDIAIVVEGKEIKAHKNILASRSPVFLAMLDTDMKEAAENSIKISDLEYDVVMELLRYFYTKQTDKIDGMAAKLLYAADKYQVKDLKELCEDVLSQQLSVENVCDLLILAEADLHSCCRLETETLEFIRLKAAEVIKSEGYARLTQVSLLKKIQAKTVQN